MHPRSLSAPPRTAGRHPPAGRALPAVLLCALVLPGCRDSARWYRGNTHAHTVICGHADSTPEAVARWYLEHDYNFLILSEHNHFIDPATVRLPATRRHDFILIPGEEVSETGYVHVHTTGMNTRHLTPRSTGLARTSEAIQDHVDGVRVAGGEPILNHPNHLYAVTATDLFPVRKLHLFELFNGHPLANNFGDGEHPATEALWDELLTQGRVVYGVSSDDAHYFSLIDDDYSNPGRGWVMVRAQELSPDAITAAMARGDFYASSGVVLSHYTATAASYRIEVDRQRTAAALSSPGLRGRRVRETEEGYTIELIGPAGRVLSTTPSSTVAIAIDTAHAYVRARVTFRRAHPDHGSEEFYAWGQPVFTDGRRTDGGPF